jgi:hypothetical protein
MTLSKAIQEVKRLETLEQELFKTYRQWHNDADKVTHLRKMADVIEQKDKLKKKYRI